MLKCYSFCQIITKANLHSSIYHGFGEIITNVMLQKSNSMLVWSGKGFSPKAGAGGSSRIGFCLGFVGKCWRGTNSSHLYPGASFSASGLPCISREFLSFNSVASSYASTSTIEESIEIVLDICCVGLLVSRPSLSTTVSLSVSIPFLGVGVKGKALAS